MGTSDVLLYAKVGKCSGCNSQYVTSAYIAADDSHFTVSEKYACPTCKTDKPIYVTPAKDEQLKFAHDQLNKRLYWQEPNGLEIIASELNR